MKVLHVGGAHLFNRFSNLEAAIERADHDDIIELHKDVHGVSARINKNITIRGNGHAIIPADGLTALSCSSFITLDNIWFKCSPRTNAVVIKDGGLLKHIKTTIEGSIRALYPTIVQNGGSLSIEDSEIMFMETHRGHGSSLVATTLERTVIKDYYGGFAYLDDGNCGMSKFRGTTRISNSEITCVLLEGECTLSNTVLKNFNRVTGSVEMISCTLQAARGKIHKWRQEPADGPLKNLRPNVIPYALHIAGGSAYVVGYSSDMESDCIGFYMSDGSLEVSSSDVANKKLHHLVKGGSVMFTNTTDSSFYEIGEAHCSVVRSKVNLSREVKSAMEELDEMIGLDTVKKQLRTIVNTIEVNMKFPEKNFGFSHHMVFAGDPGTGKTTVAKLVARALFEIGAIPEDKCMEVPASKLIKGFVGQTAENVDAIMNEALGGVLFIDEAYELAVKDNQNTFNNDALAVLLRYMEDYRDSLIVIAAGYEKEMREFLASNVGLTRRFQWVSFEDYDTGEMADIFMLMAQRFKEEFGFANVRDELKECFERLTGYYLTHPDSKGRVTNGGNGGLVRNLFQQIVFVRNNRIAENPQSSMEITLEDIKAGFDKEWAKAVNVI